MAYESIEQGAKLGANFVLEYQSFNEHTAKENPNIAGFIFPGFTYPSSDVFQWPYMDRGSNQDIGAAEAARMIHDADHPNRIVDFMIFDGGFLDSADLPQATIFPNSDA